jgi:dipeptidyl aminopeptidase/acylaminoacyl peptidase
MHAHLLVVARGKSVKRLRMLERRWANLKRAAAVGGLAGALLAAASYEVYRGWRIAAESHQRQVGVNLGYGSRALDSGDVLGSLGYFTEALYLDHGNAEREKQHRLRIGSALAQGPKLVKMWFRDQEVDTVSFSPDGEHLLIAEQYGVAQVFDIATGNPATPPLKSGWGLRQSCYSPDGNLIVTANEDKTACVWKASDGKLLLTLAHANKVMSATFSPDGRRIVTAGLDHLAQVWNAITGAPELTLKGHTDGVLFAKFSPDGRWIVTASRDRTARIWDAVSGSPVSSNTALLPHPSWVVHADFSPDARTLVTACVDHKARVWDTATGKCIPPDLDHLGCVNSAQFSPDGRLIVTGGFDGTVRIWLAANHQPLNPNPLLRHSAQVMRAVIAPDGHRLAAACFDGSVRVWDLARRTAIFVGANSSLSGDGTRILTLERGGIRIEVWRRWPPN